MLAPIGQEYILDFFKSLIDGNRLGHAYMLCGGELGISFDELRNLPRAQREIIINSYMAQKEYTELTDREDRSEIQSQAFILFPEIFSTSNRRKYKRLGVWLYAI